MTEAGGNTNLIISWWDRWGSNPGPTDYLECSLVASIRESPLL